MGEPSKVMHIRNVAAEISETHRILLVMIHQVLYPMTVDVLHQVFSPFGYVQKIVTFQTSAGVQALIQYGTYQGAVTARDALQGRNVYDDCCRLDIQFSHLNELQVDVNTDFSRDFTNPFLPTEHKGRPSQMSNAAAIEAVFGGNLPRGITGTNERCTVIVENLNPERIDEDKLFSLFSIYGNVMRIKFHRIKRDLALVQMGNGFQAELAIYFLTGVVLFGKRLDVNFSMYLSIAQGDNAREYMDSNLNRFNRNVAKNYRNCCSPTRVIHVSSLPQDLIEGELASLLVEHGIIVNCKVFEKNGKRQALVQFENEEQATEALACKHAASVSGAVIRISFSKLQNI